MTLVRIVAVVICAALVAVAWGRRDGRQSAAETKVADQTKVVDQIVGKSQHVVPSVWTSPSLRVGVNYTDEDKTVGGTKVAPRSAVALKDLP